MTRGIIIFVSLLVLLLGGALIAPTFIDWNKYKEPIITQVEQATGYKLSIGGDLDMAVLPFPHVLINDLSVTVPGEEDPLLVLKSAAVNVALMPLLQKELQVTSVDLKSPDVRLALNAQGQPVWMTETLRTRMESGRAADAPATPGLEVSLGNVRISGGNFTFTDRRGGAPVQLSAIDMNISAESLAGPFTLNGGARYANAAMKVALKSARLDTAAGNAPLQGTIEFPDNAASLTFAGVAGLKDGKIDLQGETAFKSANLSQLLRALTGQENPALAKPVDAQGLVTFANDNFAARNMRASFGGQEMTGSVEIASLKQKPLDVTLVLAAADNVNLKALLPPAPAQKKLLENFIPPSLALPVDINGKADIKLTGATFDKIAAQNVTAAITKEDGKIAWQITADAFGGKVAEQGGMTYAAVTRTPQGGATYSEPKMQVRADLRNIDIEDALQPFMTAAQMKPLTPVLSDSVTGVFTATIEPRKITATPATVKIGNETLTYNMAYTLAARPALTLALGADSFDAGRWLQPPQQAGQEAATAAPSKVKIAEMAKSLALPVDLHLTLALKNVSMHGAQYDDVFFVGKVTGDRLEVDRAGLRDDAQNNIAIAGTVGHIKDLRDIDLTISGATPDAEKLLASFNVDTKKLPKNIGRAELASEFKGQADNLSFVVNLKAMQGSVESSGRLTNLLATPQVSGLNLRARHPSYVDVMRIFNPNFSSGVAMRKSLDLFASMNREGAVYKFTEMQANIGDVKATGNLDIDTGPSRPSVRGALQIGKLPVDELLGIQSGAKGTVRAATTAPTGTGGDVRWSRNALNTAWMWKFNLDLTATAESVSYGQWAVDNADFAVTLKDGTLNVSRMNGRIGGGTMALTTLLKSSDRERQPVTANATAKFQDVELEQIVRGFSGARLIRARGPVSMDLNVQSSGISPAALIFDLRGSGKAQGKDLLFEGFDLARLSRTLAAPSSSGTENITNLLNATMKGGQTAFDSFYTDIAIAEGVATFPKFRLEGKDAAITMNGSVNLPLWTVDLSSEIHLTDPPGAPPLRVVFKGPLDNPGQTFGKSAMEGYLQQMIGSKVQEVIGDKLEDALGGKLQGILGGVGRSSTRTPAAPLNAPQAAPAAPAPAEEAPPAPAEPQAQETPPAPPPSPEQQFMGIIENMIQGN